MSRRSSLNGYPAPPPTPPLALLPPLSSQAEYQELQARNQTLEQELATAKRELAQAQAEVAAAARAARSAATTVKRRRSGHDLSHRVRTRRSRDHSTGSRASRESAGSTEADTGRASSATAGGDGNDGDIWQNGSGADGGDEGQAPPAAAAKPKRASTGKGGKGARRSLRGKARRLHPPAARSRHSLGGRTSSLRRPRTAPARDNGNGNSSTGATAASTAAVATATGGGSDDEFSSEQWRSAGDALAKPLPHMNVFSRLSDYRSFTGTHRATHATIALGRNEYHNTDNSECWAGCVARRACVRECAARPRGLTTTCRRVSL